MPNKTTERATFDFSDWTIPSEDDLHRRAIVKGAAWTIPAVAASIATPTAAASTDVT
ncbi:hypothetical protein [Rathayibacter rathayi]|uniref:hypothetical protein n=1 Tax=Rathayibacter rathayi TaxID=33887 RepID=UPI000BCA2041|nr:hypothetical protein [Rathayibacter rathayi]MWV75277.1 hypothetical protein [Rathayibacter rathayi NCPPB 2980 = VKM Ac-1601]TWD68733.1 hypothetical protein FB469_0427 [Rathayibacter rathayi]SOE05132.1 hypothetical protein SAMN06295924_107106 [Rathayibacter rathayi NCPPB 2980 = VKM Ac-1601]